MRTDQEVGGEVEVVGGGAVDGVAVVGWFNDLDVSPTIEGPRLRAAWATGQNELRAVYDGSEKIESIRVPAGRDESEARANVDSMRNLSCIESTKPD